ncbi:MAG: ABC transporter ATP-binding protein [Acetobacteraceae bacterium]|nr:ABC transporter ATP-binding protein [Acetobacteraceae bacterium]
MLTVENLHAGYGRARILRGVSFALAPGEVLVLLGRNGAGKSTTMKALVGLLPATGRIRLAGTDIARWPPHRIARLGLGWVPEERRIFPDLTVAETLEVGRRPARDGRPPWTPDRLFTLFPNLGPLRDRPGGRISGGEQQMLAIARTLMGNPRLLLLDEPSEGLAPVIVDQMQAAILALKAEGVTILLAEQNLPFAARVADRAVILETGAIVWNGTMSALMNNPPARARHLQV